VVDVATNQVDWHDKFRIIFDRLLRGDVSWTRPNRRFLQHGRYLPERNRSQNRSMPFGEIVVVTP